MINQERNIYWLTSHDRYLAACAKRRDSASAQLEKESSLSAQSDQEFPVCAVSARVFLFAHLRSQSKMLSFQRICAIRARVFPFSATAQSGQESSLSVHLRTQEKRLHFLCIFAFRARVFIPFLRISVIRARVFFFLCVCAVRARVSRSAHLRSRCKNLSFSVHLCS